MPSTIVSLSDIHEKIAGEFYFTGDQVQPIFVPGLAYIEASTALDSLKRVTVCFLVLHNGFVLVGTSACVSLENFNLETGRRFAKEDALAKAWPIEGYLLTEKLFHSQKE